MNKQIQTEADELGFLVNTEAICSRNINASNY